jgi:hypothetical protein
MARNRALTMVVHIDSAAHDCYIQEEAFVRDSHTEAPPSHLADPVCLPLNLWVAGRAAGCRATQMAPLYRSLTKRCSDPRSKRYGVRMFRCETEVSCPDLNRVRGQQRLGGASPLNSRRIGNLANESNLQREWTARTAEVSRAMPMECLHTKKGQRKPLIVNP